MIQKPLIELKKLLFLVSQNSGIISMDLAFCGMERRIKILVFDFYICNLDKVVLFYDSQGLVSLIVKLSWQQVLHRLM